MNTTPPPPRLVPDRPSDAAIAQAFMTVGAANLTEAQRTALSELFIATRAHAPVVAAAPPAEARGRICSRGILCQDRDCPECKGHGSYYHAPPAEAPAERGQARNALNVIPFSDGLDPIARCYSRVRDATLLNDDLEPAQVLGVLELVKWEILRNMQSNIDAGAAP